jgi:PAS domain S-box-containing protein
MSLRLKLLAALLPLAAALVVVGVVGVVTVASLGHSAEDILRDNYRSVLAAQRMQESIERLQDAAARPLVDGIPGEPLAATTAMRRQFETELHVQEGNITEVGEGEAVARLRQAWAQYRSYFDELAALRDPAAIRDYLRTRLEPAFVATRQAAGTILALNQDAIVRRSEHARREAERMNGLMVLAALLAFAVGGVASVMTTTRVLRPLGLLTQTVRRIGEGNFEARATVDGNDELAALAGNINGMAQRLMQYRRSSLGELLLAQQASQAAIDSLPDPVIVFDTAGAVLNCNRAAEQLLGLRIDAAAQLPVAELAPGVTAVFEQTRAHVLRGKGPYVPKGFEEAVRIVVDDGERYLLPRATPVYSEEGTITGATVVLQDVTRLRRVDELRGDLVATVAHELRTPLTSLRLAVHLMIEQSTGPLTEKQADLLYAARDDCERLQSIVDELLDLARIQSGQIDLDLRPLPAAALLATAVAAWRTSAEAHQIQIDTASAPGLGEVLVDADRLQLVFSNLLSNAIRYTPPGGQITLRARASDGYVRFEVADTGPGVPAEYQQAIFEKFVRVPGLAAGGAGIGLSIAKEIVGAHGGDIGVDSPPHHGATFWFTVPRPALPRTGGVESGSSHQLS